MARISRRRGPTVNFPLPSVLTQLPQSEIIRDFDDGEVLTMGICVSQNLDAVAHNHVLAVNMNDTGLVGVVPQVSIPSGNLATLVAYGIFAVTRGRHKFDLKAQTTSGPSQQIIANSMVFVLIQLPLWDTTDDFT